MSRKLLKSLVYIGVFLAGIISCASAQYLYSNIETPLGIGFSFNPNTEAPGDWIKESQVHVYENAVVIDLEDASISKYAATGSMKPLFDENANGIRISPKSEEEIHTGDIITFEQDEQLIVHRVIETGKDEEGTYFITRGDNNNLTDGKIRFKDIRYVTIGILW